MGFVSSVPIWLQIVIAIGAGLTAIGLIWTKGIRPVARLIATMERTVPLISDLTVAFNGTPHAFEILDEIVAQFRTDSGSSLRDVVNRLDEAAKVNAAAAETLKVGVEASRLLAQQDRERIDRLLEALAVVTNKVDAAVATGRRAEDAATIIANDLARAQDAVDGVASDLEASKSDPASKAVSIRKNIAGEP